MKQLYSQLWMTNITMNGNGSPDAAGIDLNGHLFAENCTFSQLKAQKPHRGAAVHLGTPSATATLHKCTLSSNNLLDAEAGAAAVHVAAGSGLLLSESRLQECTDSAAEAQAGEARGRAAPQPCVATQQLPAASGALGEDLVAQVFWTETPFEYAVFGEGAEVQEWRPALQGWAPGPEDTLEFLIGGEETYIQVRKDAVDAADREAAEQRAAASRPTSDSGDQDAPEAGAAPAGGSKRASPSGTLIAALIGSVVVLVILAAATVTALLLLRRYRRRTAAGEAAGGGRGLGGTAAAPANGHGGGEYSGYLMQPQYGQAAPSPHGHGGIMHDKTATFGPSNVYVPGAGHAPTTGYAGGHLLGGPAAHGSSRTGPLAAPPHPPSVLPLGATAPVGGGGRPLPGAGGAPAGLTAANLSLLEQSIPAAAKAPPFGHPPAIRSKLSVEQGLQDALDSLIISGRPLMGRYTLDAASVRQITAKSVVQFASEVPEAARPVAVKFFVSRPVFEREEAALRTDALQGGFDRDAIRIESNFDGSLRAPNGYIYPPCLVMPRGEHLRAWVETRAPKLLEIAQMLMHVGRRLAAVHRNGWTHRNLHPGNILQRLGEPGNWMVTDWSCAAKIGTFPPLVDGLRYSPPEDVAAVEQGQVATKATAAADVWALGVLAFETLTGTVVFPPGTSEKQMRDRLTGRLPLPWEEQDPAGRDRVRALRGFRRSVINCLDRNPARRPRSTEVVTMWHSLFDGPTTNTDLEVSDQLPPAAPAAGVAAVAAAAGADAPEDTPAPAHNISAMPSL